MTGRCVRRGAYFGWLSFQKNALAQAPSFPSIISTDISDFYFRIYHHRPENALSHATSNRGAVHRIIEVLKRLSTNASYGLPVGGHAARLLADLLSAVVSPSRALSRSRRAGLPRARSFVRVPVPAC